MAENRARLKDAIDKPLTRGDASAGMKEMPPGILGAPINSDPHSGGRRVADNAEAPTEAAVHLTKFAKPSLGISPDVLATMDEKIPAQFAARIRENIRKK